MESEEIDKKESISKKIALMDEKGKEFIIGYMIGRIEQFNEIKHGELINLIANKNQHKKG